jgi:ABC-type oligopeptide transport system ATPase subunit
MLELQAELGISMLFISHDMAVVERVSHHVAVMYLGRIVEMGTRQEVFEDPRHEYTKTLMAAVPVADPRQRTLTEDFESKPIPSPIHPLEYDPGPTEYTHLGGEHYILNL